MVFSFLADGRAYTNYNSNCLTNRNLMPEKEMTGNEYRQYLQKNAKKLMEIERKQAIDKFARK